MNIISDDDAFAKNNPRAKETVYHILSKSVADGNVASIFMHDSVISNRRSSWLKFLSEYEGSGIRELEVNRTHSLLANLRLDTRNSGIICEDKFCGYVKDLDALGKTHPNQILIYMFLKQIVSQEYSTTIELLHSNKNKTL